MYKKSAPDVTDRNGLSLSIFFHLMAMAICGSEKITNLFAKIWAKLFFISEH
jgi:hypothetical protein